ncbi:MAG: two-component sensor histidine kinase [Gammaproteobacteria bacterium]|nr:MAG: two-component sensor histidine kinase [Gammaproteobacteria bacterium]
MSYSLRARLLLTSGLVFLFFFSLTGVILDQAFSISVKNSARERLKLHTYNLLTVADFMDGSLQVPKYLQSERFNHPDTGLFMVVLSDQRDVVWQSVSSQSSELYYGDLAAPGSWVFGTATLNNGKSYLVSNYGVIWVDDQGIDQNYTVSVVEGLDTAYEGLGRYRFQLVVILGVLGTIILLLESVILHWGLWPFKRLARDLSEIKSGRASQLAGNYPRELLAITDNLNRLIESELRQRDRYRKTMADLAHSLKTPLSVLKNVARSEELIIDSENAERNDQQLIFQQVERMDALISYQLKRAVLANDSLNRKAVSVNHSLTQILTAIQKIYQDKAVELVVDVAPGLNFYGDENDFLEMAGNLIDNAFKYASHRVVLSASQKIEGSSKFLQLTLEDDGPGVPMEQRNNILKRGARLDTMEQGQGIGLSVVRNILVEYDGELRIEDSSVGGALFCVSLPIQQR